MYGDQGLSSFKKHKKDDKRAIIFFLYISNLLKTHDSFVLWTNQNLRSTLIGCWNQISESNFCMNHSENESLAVSKIASSLSKYFFWEAITLMLLKKNILFSINVWGMNVIWTYLPCCHCHVSYQRQLCCFTAIHKSSPVASWDCKLSIGCFSPTT